MQPVAQCIGNALMRKMAEPKLRRT